VLQNEQQLRRQQQVILSRFSVLVRLEVFYATARLSIF